jgi:hypothetical protein
MGGLTKSPFREAVKNMAHFLVFSLEIALK